MGEINYCMYLMKKTSILYPCVLSDIYYLSKFMLNGKMVNVPSHGDQILVLMMMC